MEKINKAPFPNEMRTLPDFQQFHRWLDEQNSFNTDIYFNMVLLSGEVGEVAKELQRIHFLTTPHRTDDAVRTFDEALEVQREAIGQELADCLAYILKLANYTGVDLEQAYLKKMQKNLSRTWKYQPEEE